jgi:hypothetical protein
VSRTESRYITDVQFEFDPRKSQINKTKHGIDFVEAQTLWESKIVLLGAKMLWRSVTWLSGQSVPSIGPRLSPIAARRFALLV